MFTTSYASASSENLSDNKDKDSKVGMLRTMARSQASRNLADNGAVSPRKIEKEKDTEGEGKSHTNQGAEVKVVSPSSASSVSVYVSPSAAALPYSSSSSSSSTTLPTGTKPSVRQLFLLSANTAANLSPSSVPSSSSSSSSKPSLMKKPTLRMLPQARDK
jgi:hypothetical protein